MNLNHLASQASAGDKDAANELFQYLSVRFTLIAKRRIGACAAEDIAQEACLTVLEKYRSETFTKSFERWAYGVLRMKIGNYIQGPMAKQKKAVSHDDIPRTNKLADPKPNYDLKIRLLDCLRQIIKRNSLYARVLNLVYQGYTTKEICQRLQINANYFYVTLNRARKMLRTCLEKGKV